MHRNANPDHKMHARIQVIDDLQNLSCNHSLRTMSLISYTKLPIILSPNEPTLAEMQVCMSPSRQYFIQYMSRNSMVQHGS